jgi:uncharacterized membrane protein SpoIIM required for sporulation
LEIPFIVEHRPRWQRLYQLLERAKGTKLHSFSKAELIELCVLYRQTATDLAIAKQQGLPVDVIDFLNSLVGRAYHHVYRTQKTGWHMLWFFITTEFPAIFRRSHRVVLLAMGLFLAGIFFGFIGYLAGPDTVSAMLPQNITQGLLERYQENTWFNEQMERRPFISAWIMHNNIQVAIGSFAGGMLLGTYTVFVIVFNGFILGVLAAVFFQKGYLLSFWAMILPHGVIELTAIGISAAGGLSLARAILFPGELSRSDALRIYGTDAVKLLGGTVFLLIIAGLIEGYLSTISRAIVPEIFRLLFAGLTGLALLWYFGRGACHETAKKAPVFSDRDNDQPRRD